MRPGESDAEAILRAAGWRRSSRSNPSGNCVELALVRAARHRPPAAPPDTKTDADARPG